MANSEEQNQEMKTFDVELPILVKLKLCIPSNCKQEAMDIAFDSDISIDINVEGGLPPHIDIDDIECEWEWERYKKIVEGNIFLGSINSAKVTELEEW